MGSTEIVALLIRAVVPVTVDKSFSGCREV
jgi:hypothetical protein